jgi:hypothetical protein
MKADADDADWLTTNPPAGTSSPLDSDLGVPAIVQVPSKSNTYPTICCACAAEDVSVNRITMNVVAKNRFDAHQVFSKAVAANEHFIIMS